MRSRIVFRRPAFWRLPASRACLLAVLAFVCANSRADAGQSASDLAALPIEQLLAMEVSSASKFVQKVSEAPSAVSIITAADIKAFGWRTLADALRSVRGLHASYDRNYDYVGARGFLRPGDYNTRFLLLVDGKRLNDGVYDQASVGTEFMVDLDLVERIEYVSGPGSSIYGANAFFGVINVITRRATDIPGARASVEAGSHGARKVRASYGLITGSAEWLLSATSYRERGGNLYFPEFDIPGSGDGIARRLDHDRADSVFIKGAAGPFSLSIAHNERSKGMPTASFSQVFGDPRSQTVDTQSMVDLGYRSRLAADTELSVRLDWGRYDYDGEYAYDAAPLGLNRDGSRSRWWGGEAKLVSTRISGHKIVAGTEYRRDVRRDQFNYDVNPYALLLDDRRTGNRHAVYLQDEITLRDDLLLNAGLRHDRTSSSGGIVNPRMALIYKATPATTLKAAYGKAYREPNAYERYYALSDTGGQKANPDLRSERIRSVELIAEQQLAADTRITAAVFRNSVTDLISQTSDPADGLLVFRNLSHATAYGAEFEAEKAWARGARLRTSYSWQRAVDRVTGAELVNSPRHLGKLNLTAPFYRSWRAGLEAQYVSARRSLQGRAPSYWLGNLTVSSVRLAPGLEIGASLYNVFDRRYSDPGAEEHVQDLIAQNGRTFRVKLSYAF
ncbi:TonB-dependent receptor [Noviherbaspirillum sp. CPCC 100848]|uniref:TonB-dependent receptor n=1 Tax=Noviherbaspirillum album TaxID=3080276 RepID=A0ABU6JH57_9BURK|nr:TonB-dependent receptor [Noviherbaspirillum sp. CPCC 100848]MEC4723005.1 TonB-dependent receptor [Noviherbaspirillum sp. CPCC 100848]